ncbi:HK97-gp10 family putative phage morphogenesis protein [Acinetobacter bereziniae]|uniref:HK97-gp10 family putative phage morphogenesis protein n=1 Tax=Acinetobacter bereziniae TaxID=106648 RepID=UPI00124FDD45|nr:HK97-gp10 family putative phage morphogenesis protein [Acinetobacter bereziniae]
MSNVKFEIQGLEQLQSKLEKLSDPKKVKSLARKALRQAANIVRDAARNNARAIDDPETAAMIYKNIVARSGRIKGDAVRDRVGILGGASFGDGKTTILSKKQMKNFVGPMPTEKVIGLSGGDTRHWRYLEFGAATTPAKPFMRPALINNIQPVTDKFVQVMSDEINKALASGS